MELQTKVAERSTEIYCQFQWFRGQVFKT